MNEILHDSSNLYFRFCNLRFLNYEQLFSRYLQKTFYFMQKYIQLFEPQLFKNNQLQLPIDSCVANFQRDDSSLFFFTTFPEKDLNSARFNARPRIAGCVSRAGMSDFSLPIEKDLPSTSNPLTHTSVPE